MTAFSRLHARTALGACFSTLTLVGAVGGAQAADFNDTFLGYRQSGDYREPGNANHIAKSIYQLTHVSTHAWGSNFFNADAFVSDNKDRANNSTAGAQEIYLTYRNQLSLAKTTGVKLPVVAVRDVALTSGFDLNSKDTAFAPRKRAWVLGPTVRFDVPGFLDLSLLYYSERNHRGLTGTLRPDVAFDPSYMLAASWGVPFQAGPAPLKFQGFLNYVAPKGLDSQNVKTVGETLMRTSLMVDVGQLAFDKKNALWAGVGYEYWHNKFGNPKGVGTDVRATQLQVEYHF